MPDLPKLRFEEFNLTACTTEGFSCSFWSRSECLLRICRSNGKWKWPKGKWTNGDVIAKAIFDYDRQSVSECEIEYMRSFIDCVGDVMDCALAEARNLVATERKRMKRPLKNHFLITTASEQIKAMEQKETGPDYVYLMSHANGLTKIGFSKNPKTREKTLQAEDPRLNLIDFFVASKETELRLHKIFKDVRVRGEWFNLRPHHIDWICWFFKGGTHAKTS